MILIEHVSAPFTSAESRTWWLGLLVAAIIGCFVTKRRTGRWLNLSFLKYSMFSKSTVLDIQLLILKQIIRVVVGFNAIGLAYLVGVKVSISFDNWFGVPELGLLNPTVGVIAYSAALFIVSDLSRFVLHYIMHRVGWLWELHKVHHSSTVLTPITFHRIHPLETVLHDLRGALVTGTIGGIFFWISRGDIAPATLLGVPAIGLILNVSIGNIRHSHIWISFPDWVERVIISPAQHQVHHSSLPRECHSNMGTWLAFWDYWAGTWRPSSKPPEEYGLTSNTSNHSQDLISAIFGPIRSIVSPAAVALFLASFTLLPTNANASEDTDSDEEVTSEETSDDPDAASEELIVLGDTRAPRMAGSAQTISEEELQEFSRTNIEAVISGTPSVTVRSEDGFGLRPNIGIRGANSDRSAKITLMEDGVLFAPAPYAAPAAYYFPMAARISGVEVYLGPAATMYGPFTVGGAINLTTRGIPGRFTTEGGVTYGSFGTRTARAWAGELRNNFGYTVEMVHEGSDGFKVLDNGGETGFERSEFVLKSELFSSPLHTVEMKLGYGQEESYETYLGLSRDDFGSTPYRRYAASALGEMRWSRTQAEVRWRLSPSPSFEVETVAYHHWLDRSWNKFNRFAGGIDLHETLMAADPSGSEAVYLAILRGEEPTTTPDQVLLIGNNHRTFQNFGVQSNAFLALGNNNIRHDISMGARLHADLVRRVHTEAHYSMANGILVNNGEPDSTTLDSEAVALAAAFHVHDDIEIGKVHIFPGIRLEMIEGWRTDNDSTEDDGERLFRATPLPGLGGLYAISQNVDIFAGVHRGFSPVAPGQPAEIEPETTWNSEIGVSYDSYLGRLESVLYYNDYQNISGQCSFSSGCTGDEVDNQFNGGEAIVFGAELSASTEVFVGTKIALPLSLAYTWTESHFTSSFYSDFPQFGQVEVGDSLPYQPTHSSKAQVGFRYDRLALYADCTYRSAMLDSAGQIEDAPNDVPQLLLFGASAHLPIHDSFSLFTTVTNITDQSGVTSWRPFGARPTAPMQVIAGLRLD